jgi:hypothetical protein
MSDNIKNRQKAFNNLVSVKLSQEELKVKFANIQHLITLIGENDNYVDVLKSFDGIEADDVSITNAQELRNDFVQQLIEQLGEFKIHLLPSNVDKLSEKTIILPVSQAA